MILVVKYLVKYRRKVINDVIAKRLRDIFEYIGEKYKKGLSNLTIIMTMCIFCLTLIRVQH